jgi:uncharacterized protein YeaO (DUF488 family)
MRWKISVGRISLNRAYCLPSWHDVTRILVDRLWPRGVRNSEAAINPWTRTIARLETTTNRQKARFGTTT